MTDEPNDDAADEAIFEELLNKKGKKWLTDFLTEMGITAPKPAEPSGSPSPSPSAAPEGNFLAFLQSALTKSEQRAEGLSARLAEALDALTPEQRRELKSQSAGGGDPAKPKPKNPPKPSAEPQPQPPAVKPSWRRKPLQRL